MFMRSAAPIFRFSRCRTYAYSYKAINNYEILIHMDHKKFSSKGGKARVADHTPEELSEINRRAAIKGWKTKKARLAKTKNKQN